MMSLVSSLRTASFASEDRYPTPKKTPDQNSLDKTARSALTSSQEKGSPSSASSLLTGRVSPLSRQQRRAQERADAKATRQQQKIADQQSARLVGNRQERRELQTQQKQDCQHAKQSHSLLGTTLASIFIMMSLASPMESQIQKELSKEKNLKKADMKAQKAATRAMQRQIKSKHQPKSTAHINPRLQQGRRP